MHLAGTVYTAFYRWTANCGNAVKSADVVVVRDDNWATGPNPFTFYACTTRTESSIGTC